MAENLRTRVRFPPPPPNNFTKLRSFYASFLFFPFKKIKKINDQNQEFWYARDLQNVLAYSSWERFKSVIQKTVVACNNSKQPVQTEEKLIDGEIDNME